MINTNNKVKTVKDKKELMLNYDFVDVVILNPCSCSLCNNILNKDDIAFINEDLDFGQYVFCLECYRK